MTTQIFYLWIAVILGSGAVIAGCMWYFFNVKKPVDKEQDDYKVRNFK